MSLSKAKSFAKKALNGLLRLFVNTAPAEIITISGSVWSGSLTPVPAASFYPESVGRPFRDSAFINSFHSFDASPNAIPAPFGAPTDVVYYHTLIILFPIRLLPYR